MVNEAREQEVWRTYPDYDFIEVSNLGRVRTKDRYVPCRNGGKRLVKGRVLKQWLSHGGYLFVTFGANGKRVSLLVHRMVAICYIPNPDNLPEVNHIDNDRTNNVVSNLEWCTSQYNTDYKKNFGTSSTEVLGRPVIAIDLNSFKVLLFESQCEVAGQLGVFQSNVWKVVNGERNKTGGYWFCYADSSAVEKVRAKFGGKVAEKVEKLLSERKII